MFFSLHLGLPTQTPPWKDVVELHAARVSMKTDYTSYSLPQGHSLEISWMTPQSGAGDARLTQVGDIVYFDTGGHWQSPYGKESAEHIDWLKQEPTSNALLIRICTRTGTIQALVPPFTSEQLFYCDDANRGRVLTNDMRLIIRWAGLEIDPNAVYSLFQFGCIIPPATITKNAQRALPGHAMSWPMADAEPRMVQSFFPARIESSPESPETLVERALDDLLSRVPESSVLYFSGGVDSTLMAIRLLELGRSDVRLLNYSFGEDDKEAQLALDVAGVLGLPCTQVNHDVHAIPAMLNSIAKDYAYPFGDCSTLPTNLLVRKTLEMFPDCLCILDGTGADGAFEVVAKYRLWSRLYSKPRLMRSLIGAAYKYLGMWRWDSGNRHRPHTLERVGWVCRRSVQGPMVHSIFRDNPLDGIAYRIPPDVYEEMEGRLEANYDALSEGLDPVSRMSVFDELLDNGGTVGPKLHSPLAMAGIQAIFPFMEPPIYQASLRLPWEVKRWGGEDKGLLKKMVAKRVPKNMVYRTKSGFAPPIRDILALDCMQEILNDNVLNPDNPLLEFVDCRILQEMIRRSNRKQMMAMGATNFLWVLLFTTEWVRQCNPKNLQEDEKTCRGA